MIKSRAAMQSRSRLDQRFEQMGPPSRFAPPVRGWIRAIRSALGMTSAQLAKRLGIRQPSVVALEQSEAKGTIELATLRRAAEALDATLVYALVPNRTLESMVRERARQRLAPLEHSMRLEDQGLTLDDSEAQLEEFVRSVNPSRLWDER